MANKSCKNHISQYDSFEIFLTYLPVIIIIFGLIGNLWSFLIFAFNKEMKRYSSMMFLAFICVFNTTSLFTWNLDNFLAPNFKVSVISISPPFGCKFFVFLQILSLHCSGILYAIISIDRYFTVTAFPGSFKSRLPFGTRKTAFIWCICICVTFILFNTYLLILNGKYSTISIIDIKNTSLNSIHVDNYTFKKFQCYQSEYSWVSIVPAIDVILALIHTITPFIVMLIFNTLLILNICRLTRKKNASKEKQKIKLTISLLLHTFLFICMSMPSNIAFGFFLSDIKCNRLLGSIFDSIL